MTLTGKTIGELAQLSSVTEDTLFAVEYSGKTFNLPYSAFSPTYKVYTALLTQSGGDDLQSQQSGLLTVGVTYYIDDNASNPDFTNVGAPNNNVGTYFVATGTTPNSWGEATLNYNTGAPVVTVLENTIGNVWFTYNGVGNYRGVSDSLFTLNKTIIYSSIDQFQTISADLSLTGTLNDSQIGYQTFISGTLTNDSVGFIEIRVYN
jgi:hypothetical protein